MKWNIKKNYFDKNTFCLLAQNKKKPKKPKHQKVR